MEVVLPALAVVISALIAVGGVVYTSKQGAKAKEKQEALEKKQVENEAYMRARKIDEGVIERLQSEIQALQEAVRASRERADVLERRMEEEEQESLRLRKELLAEKEVTSLLRTRLQTAEETVQRLLVNQPPTQPGTVG